MKTHSLFKFLSSLKLAVLCLLSLAGVLAAATICESLYGMRAAHVLVYGTWWFYGLLGLLGTNVLCAALSRYPWKKHQTGFVITHAGILTILLGSWVTQHYGVDGNLPVAEGSQDGEVILNELKLSVIDDEAGRTGKFPVPESALRREGRLMEIGLAPEELLVVDGYVPRAQLEKKTVASPVPGIGTAAVQVEIYNDRFRVEEWLSLAHPEKPTEANLGPALLTFQKLWTDSEVKNFLRGEAPAKVAKQKAKSGERGFIVANYEGREYRVDTARAMKEWVRLGSTAFELKVERYLPFAVVEKNELVSRSEEPINPAVQLGIRNSLGAEEKHTLFANFPEFSTRHKQKAGAPVPVFGITLKMVAVAGARTDLASAQTAEREKSVRGKLEFAQGPRNEKLYYRIKSASQPGKSGEVRANEEVATGWMNLKFKVLNWLPASIEIEDPHYVEYIEGSDSGLLAGLKVHQENLTANASVAGEAMWLFEGSAKSVNVGEKRLMLVYTRDRLNLPFQLALKKFTIGNDPGTTKAATYESEVVVRDPDNADAPSVRISMNEPLNYGGYTFYQASYQLQEGRPPISVFSVNFDPGRWVKYAGSIIMVFGILIMFYLNPHYVGLLLNRKGKTA